MNGGCVSRSLLPAILSLWEWHVVSCYFTELAKEVKRICILLASLLQRLLQFIFPPTVYDRSLKNHLRRYLTSHSSWKQQKRIYLDWRLATFLYFFAVQRYVGRTRVIVHSDTKIPTNCGWEGSQEVSLEMGKWGKQVFCMGWDWRGDKPKQIVSNLPG